MLSPPAEYRAEARGVRKLVRQALGAAPRGRRWQLLELGCGGGHTLSHLRQHFDVEACDLSEPMLAQCRRLNPGVSLHQADMCKLRLKRTFDVVLLHDAVDHLTSMRQVTAALRTAYAHLRPGGVLVLGPTYLTEHFIDGDRAGGTGQDADRGLELRWYVRVGRLGKTRFALDMQYVMRQGGRIHWHHERQVCGLFSGRQWRQMLRQAGFVGIAGAEVPATNMPWHTLLARRSLRVGEKRWNSPARLRG